MFTVSKTADNRIDIEVQGRIDADAMREGLDALIAESEGIRNGLMFYRITDFSFPSLEAIGVEFRRLPKLFALIGRFDKCAVVSDEGWLRTAAEIEGAVIPGLTIKAFEPDAEAAAEAWLTAGPPRDNEAAAG